MARLAVAQCRATLEEGLAMFPDDPFAEECRRLVKALTHRAEPDPAPVAAPTRPASGTGDEPLPEHDGRAGPRTQAGPRPAGALRTLTDALLASPEGRDYLGSGDPAAFPELTEADDARLWQWFHLALLRLPEEYARAWGDKAAALPQGAPREVGPVLELPALHGDEVLVPARADLGVAGIRTRTGAALASWLPPGEPPPRDGPRHRMCVLASQVMAVAALDPSLRRCLEHLDRTAMSPMADPEVTGRYRGDLARRIGLIPQAPVGTATISTLISVDESLCSLLHLPPAAPGSWWDRLARASHETVLVAARELAGTGEEVEVRVLSGAYPEIRRRTGTTDLPVRVGYRSGQVLACLRLWARVEGRVLPGRVAYAVG
jgi:hypothetical protein